MTKKWLFFLSLFFVLGLFLTGCTKPVQNVYYEVIPENSSVIASINVNRLVQKSEAKEKILDWARLHQQGNLDKLEVLLKNGNETGLDLNEAVYLFVDNSQGGLVAKVADFAKLKETFGLLQKEGECEPLTEKNGYFRTVVGGEMVFLFNENLLLGIGLQENVENTFEYASRLLKPKSSGKIGDTAGFKKLTEANSDMACWFSYAAVIENCNSPAQYQMPNGVDLSKVDFLCTLNFEQGKISLSYEIISEDPAVKAWVTMAGQMNNRFLNFFPSSTLLYFGGSMDGEKVIQQLEKNNQWASQLKIKDKAEFLKILSAFKGDISWGITSLTPMGIPSLLAYAEVNDAYPVEALAGALKEQAPTIGDVRKISANVYEAKIQMLGMTLYFGMKDKALYLTNDADLYRNLNKNAAQPLGDMQLFAGFKNASMGCVLNLEEALQSPVVQMGIYQIVGQQQGASMLQTLSMFSYVEILGISNKAFFNIYLKDKEQNSLKTLVEEGEKLALQ